MGNSNAKQALPRRPPNSHHRNKGTQTDFPEMNSQLGSTSSGGISGVTTSRQQSSNNDATPSKTTITNPKPSGSVGKGQQHFETADNSGSTGSSSSKSGSGRNCKLEKKPSKRLTTGQKVAIGAGVAGVATLGAVGAVVAAPILIAGVGFGAAGVTAGSLAAAWQSSIGAVAAGSFFASLQSAGAAGLAVGTQAAIGAAGAATGAGVGAGVGAAASKFKSNKESKPEAKTKPESNTKSEPRDDSNSNLLSLEELLRILEEIRAEYENEGPRPGTWNVSQQVSETDIENATGCTEWHK